MRLKNYKFGPTEDYLKKLDILGTKPIRKQVSLMDLLKRAEIEMRDLSLFGDEFIQDDLVSEPVEIRVKYQGYIDRQNEIIAQTKKLEKMQLDENLNYEVVRGLKREEVEKLNLVSPRTIAQAQRISGVNPSAIQAILIHLKKEQRSQENV